MRRFHLAPFLLSLCICAILTACANSATRSFVFPAYTLDDTVPGTPSQTPTFTATVTLPRQWSVSETAPDTPVVPGDFYTPLYLYDGDTPVGYIGFNRFEPYTGEIDDAGYYMTVYPSLRLGFAVHWGPYTPVKTSENAETAVADIVYLDPAEIENHPGAMPSVPQLETVGILSYDKTLGVYVGIAFFPDTVTRTEAEEIAQSLTLSPSAP